MFFPALFPCSRHSVARLVKIQTHTRLTCSAHPNPSVDSIVEKFMLSLDVHDRLEVLGRGLEDQPGIEGQGQILIVQVDTAGVEFSLGRCTQCHARVTVR